MTLPAPKIYLIQPSYWGRVWWQFRRALVATYEDGCLGIAKGAAYSALLAFFPVLTSLATILVQAQLVDISPIISQLLAEAVPPGSEQLVLSHFVAQGQRPRWLLVAAALLSVWAASGAMMSLIEGFQAVYRIPTGRSFWKQRSVAVMLVFTTAVPLVAASVLILAGQRVENGFLRWLRVVPEGRSWSGWVVVAGIAGRYAIAMTAIVLVTVALFYFGPNRRQSFSRVWPGALIASVLWVLSVMAFGWYVRNIANYNVLYGSVGAAMALLVWMYVLAVVALIGCEYNSIREKAMTSLAE